MIVNVRMADGRTTFQFASRKDLTKAIGTQVDDSITTSGWVKWTDESEWRELHVVHIRKHSIAFVVNAADVAESDADLPAKAVAAERVRKWEEREREAAAA